MADLKINKKFAEKYEKYRQKEELQRLKDRYGDQDEPNSSDSSDSDTDESEVELDPKLDRDFYRTLSLLKKKDPKIYQTDAKFYSEESSESGDEEKPSTSKKSEKPMFLKDYERKVILERGGKYDDEEEDSDEEISNKMQERAASPTYIQEQKDLKESFRKFLHDSDEEGSSDKDEELLTRRTKTQEEKDREEADYVEWLKGQAELEGEEEIKDMKYLRDYWNNPGLDEKESFLRDYVLNKGYLEEDDEERIPTYDEVVQDDVDDSEGEGESFLQKQEDFERHYNFRFEEPDAGKVKTYPRNIATSVRSKDDRRKIKREEVKERKKKEKEQKQQQLKELKNLKRAEIMGKLKKLQELTGNKQLTFNEIDLEGDFDPQTHDQIMQKFFSDEYYEENEDEKPQFDDDDDDDEGKWNWDTWTGKEEEEGGEEEDYNAEAYYEPNCEDPNFIMDADYDPSEQPVSKKKRKKEREEKKKKSKDDAPLMGKKRKKSHFAEIMNKNKPVFDPMEKTFEQYLDEYYKLDYEDIIDDLPCRFRYRDVVPNDFGLSTDEILNAEERELNSWCSLKKTCMYRSEKDELCDVKNFQIKAQNVRRKEEVFKSLYNMNEDEEMTGAKGKMGKKRRDRVKRSDEKKNPTEQKSETGPADVVDQTGQDHKDVTAMGDEEEEQFLVPKNKKVKVEESPATPNEMVPNEKTEKPKLVKKTHRRPHGRLLTRSSMVKMGGREFSRQRLKAYGLNPKRLHFRELYRQKRKEREKKENREKKSKQ